MNTENNKSKQSEAELLEPHKRFAIQFPVELDGIPINFDGTESLQNKVLKDLTQKIEDARFKIIKYAYFRRYGSDWSGQELVIMPVTSDVRHIYTTQLGSDDLFFICSMCDNVTMNGNEDILNNSVNMVSTIKYSFEKKTKW